MEILVTNIEAVLNMQFQVVFLWRTLAGFHKIASLKKKKPKEELYANSVCIWKNANIIDLCNLASVTSEEL